MPTRQFGARIKRTEDPRLLTGQGRYVDDIDLPGMLHAAVLRSPHAHARIRAIDVGDVLAIDGVLNVLTYEDLDLPGERTPLLIPHAALTHGRTQHVLARDQVNYVGEAIALVVAVDRYAAEDALEAIQVEYEVLPPVVNVTTAVEPGSALVHDDLGTNVAAHYTANVGDVERAFAEAAHVFREPLVIERSASMPMETRGVVAYWDNDEGLLRVWDSTQAPVSIRNGLASLFGLPEHKVQVQAPDVGGGFGSKVMQFYPEEILIPLVSMRMGRPMKWVEDRREHFIATNHERLQIHDAEIAVDGEGRILAVRDRYLHDTGAYTPYGIIVPQITACQLPGPYKVPNYAVEFRAVYTNTVPISPYRGAGRPHGCFVMERLLERVAAELSLDRAEVRRRNFVRPEDFPYDVGLTFQDGAPTRYDSGNYEAGLDKALAMIDYENFAREVQPRARAEGRCIGLGLACYVEGTGIGPYEGAHVRVEPGGKIFVSTGLASQGQSHTTTFAQVAAEELGVSVDDVMVTSGDSRYFNFSTGTFASRGAVVSGNAVALAARAVREKALALAARHLEVDPSDLEVREGTIAVKGAPGRELAYGQVARLANPLRYVYGTEAADAPQSTGAWTGPALRAGEHPGLEAIEYYSPPHATWASGVHACIVEVDVDTGMIHPERYCIVHDCGTLINPMVVEGQVHGGVAQGIGGSFYERMVYDDNGQLLNASFMDFLIPTAGEIPHLEIEHIETPSPLNPLGIKGVGEAGAIPVPALLASALEDALRPLGIHITRMPLSPSELRELIAAARPHEPGLPLRLPGLNAPPEMHDDVTRGRRQ
jgi:aerobic carbon-monoxide dehydrogenase large subunit